MNRKILFYSIITSLLFFIFFTSCEKVSTQSGVDDSLETVEEVSLISGTSNTVITVNKSAESFFKINFSGIGTNDIINDGEKEGWCIDWQMPINSSNGSYDDIQLYSTYNVEKWKPINFLFNNMDYLKQEIPGITNLEIQIVIWELRGYPEFDLNQIQISDLPNRMHSDNQILFDQEIVTEMLQIIKNGYQDFDYVDNPKFVVITETPADVQTLITVVEK